MGYVTFKVGCLGPRTSDEYCAALLSVLGSDWASGVRYRSTVPGSGAGDVVGWLSSVQPGLSDKYCAAISGF